MHAIKVLYESDTIAAVASGIADGDQVIIEGQLRLTPGASATVIASG
jgi:hypothetical protein